MKTVIKTRIGADSEMNQIMLLIHFDVSSPGKVFRSMGCAMKTLV